MGGRLNLDGGRSISMGGRVSSCPPYNLSMDIVVKGFFVANLYIF